MMTAGTRPLRLVPNVPEKISKANLDRPPTECRVDLNDLISIEAAMITSWQRGEGRVLTLTGTADPWRVGLLRAVTQRAVRGRHAVAYFDALGALDTTTAAFARSLSTGQSPILSLSCARMVAGMNQAPLKQAHLLERLLRRHAHHRPILIGIDGAYLLDQRAQWILRRLPELLCDCPVTWLYSYLQPNP